MKLKALIGAVALVISTGCLTAPANAAFPGTNGKLALTARLSLASGHHPIYTMHSDGSSLTAITAENAGTVAWSPDGSKIVTDVAPMRLMYLDGSGNHAIGGGGANPAWSPDGSKIVFNGTQLLYTMNPDGSGVTQLTPFAFRNASEPAWQPTGAKVAFTRTPEGSSRQDIYTANASDGRGNVNLTADLTSPTNSQPDWSPDGTKIVFRNSDGIWTMNADGSGKTMVHAGFGLHPVWSPDGTKIAFGNSGIYIMNADGTNKTLVLTEYFLGGLDWQSCPGGTCAQPPVKPPFDVPAAASSLSVPMVPNFRQTISDFQCQARGGTNSSHGPPLAFSSCDPPGFLPGTAARLGPFAESTVTFTRTGGDIFISGGALDVRTPAGTPYNPVPGSSHDMTMVVRVRLSDRFTQPTFIDPGTTTDFDLVLPAACTSDPEEPAVGSTCGLSASVNSLMPEAFGTGRQSVVQLFDVKMKDAGANATPGDSDDRFFAAQGIYIP